MIVFLPQSGNFDSSKHQQMMEECKNNFENKIRQLMYETLIKSPDEFIKEKYIPNRIKTLDNLIEKFKTTEEYEKCGFLNNLKNKIEKSKNKKEII